MLNYLSQNWIAVFALLISLGSLATGIASRREKRQIQIQEKNYGLKTKYVSVINDMELSIFELILLQIKFDKIKKQVLERNSKLGGFSPKHLTALKFLTFIEGTIKEQLETIERVKPEYEHFLDESFQKDKRSLVELTRVIEHLNLVEKTSLTSKDRLSKLVKDLEFVIDEDLL